MPRRGLSEGDVVQIGTFYMTAAEGAAAAGDADGRPLNGTWLDVDAYDPNPGVTQIGATGRIVTIGYPIPSAGGLWSIQLIFTRYDPVAHLAALRTLFASFTQIDPVVPPLVDGRTWTGIAKPNRLNGQLPLEEQSGDHPRYGGQGRELHVRLLSSSGGF